MKSRIWFGSKSGRGLRKAISNNRIMNILWMNLLSSIQKIIITSETVTNRESSIQRKNKEYRQQFLKYSETN